MVLPAVAASAEVRCSCSLAARVDMVLVRFDGVPPDLPEYALIRCGIYTCYGQPDIGCRFHGSEIRDSESRVAAVLEKKCEPGCPDSHLLGRLDWGKPDQLGS